MYVKKKFYCIQTKKKYKVGQKYSGKRTDLSDFLSEEKPTASKPKASPKTSSPAVTSEAPKDESENKDAK